MKKLVFAVPFALPLLALAQIQTAAVTSLTGSIISIINGGIIPVLFALAILYFLWGIVKYLMSGGDEKARKEAISMMLYGIIAIAVMSSVWGLVNVFRSFITQSNSNPNLPGINNLNQG
jgi:predicted PurR-regulated permease PerM